MPFGFSVRPVLNTKDCRPTGRPPGSHVCSSDINPLHELGGGSGPNLKSLKSQDQVKGSSVRGSSQYTSQDSSASSSVRGSSQDRSQDSSASRNSRQEDIEKLMIKERKRMYWKVASTCVSISETMEIAKYIASDVKKRVKSKLFSHGLSKALHQLLENENRADIWYPGDEPSKSSIIPTSTIHSSNRSSIPKTIDFTGVINSVKKTASTTSSDSNLNGDIVDTGILNSVNVVSNFESTASDADIYSHTENDGQFIPDDDEATTTVDNVSNIN